MGDLPGLGWKGVLRGTREGPYLHVEQLGRLVHPDRDGALTQSFAQHFLEGIPHLIHPTHRQEQGVASARVSSEPSAPPRPAPECMHESPRTSSFCKPGATPAPSPAMTPRTPRGRVSCENPRECHPPPSALPVPGAGRSHRLPAAAAARPRGSLLPFAKAQRGSAGLGGYALSIRGRPFGGFPREKRLGVLSTNFYPLAPQQPSPAWLHCGAHSERVQGEAPADLPFGLLLSCRKFLQSHIATAGPPQRESGVRAAPATVGTRAPALCTPSQVSPAQAAAARSASLAPLAFGPSPRVA